LGDRFGRKYIIWISILGAAPLLALICLDWYSVSDYRCRYCFGFSAILVFCSGINAGKSGYDFEIIFCFFFGMGGLGSALLGYL
jgi:FSR family fosmidomycin resistance protein-like MFS transporter